VQSEAGVATREEEIIRRQAAVEDSADALRALVNLDRRELWDVGIVPVTLRTDASGRYELRTIRPAPYPGGGVPAHIHYVVEGAGYPEQRFELHFEGDPYLSERMQASSREAGRFGSIRPVEVGDDGVSRVTFDLRLRR
jgi:Dioxygenase